MIVVKPLTVNVPVTEVLSFRLNVPLPLLMLPLTVTLLNALVPALVKLPVSVFAVMFPVALALAILIILNTLKGHKIK